ncbi:MAG: hypothetical protein OXJ52_01415 [Oligoflexia bacterium]|nr:hypothetical protein [Oligoflexia bacterium]
MKSIIQIFHPFIVILVFLNISVSSTMPLNPASACRTFFIPPNFVMPDNNIDHLNRLLPKNHKLRMQSGDYPNVEDRPLSGYDGRYFHQLVTAIFSKENEGFFKQVITDSPGLLEFRSERDQKNFLHFAAISNNLEIVKFLAGFKQLINQKDSIGFNPLLLAMTGARDLDIFEFLLALPDTDTSIEDIWGDNIFHYVFLVQSNKKRAKVLDLLFEYFDSNLISALINSVNHNGESSFNYLIRDFEVGIAHKILNKTSIDFSQVTKQGNNFLHIAGLIPSVPAIKFLLEHSHIDVEQKNHLGLTPAQIFRSHYPDKPIMFEF